MSFIDDAKNTAKQKFSYKSLLADQDPGNFFGLRQEVAAPQGPAGVDANGAGQATQKFLQKQPNGTYVDTSTGLAYSDQYGQELISDPNVAQQAQAQTAIRQQLLSKLAASDEAESRAASGQSNLVGQLDATINGSAPSAAGIQLGHSQGAVERTQLALAAGASGGNAFAARRQAAANIANAQVQNSNSAALLRAKETADAQGLKAGVLGQMAAGAAQKYSTDLSGANTFDRNASDSEQFQQKQIAEHNKQVTDAENANSDRRQNKITGLAGKIIGSIF